jgi:hypothetical protein
VSGSLPVRFQKYEKSIIQSSTAEIAQLGEQQTEVLKVACSIHALGIASGYHLCFVSKTQWFAKVLAVRPVLPAWNEMRSKDNIEWVDLHFVQHNM